MACGKRRRCRAPRRGADPLERIYDLRSSFRFAASKRVALRADVMYNYERQRWPLPGSGGFNGFTDIQGVSGWTEATLDAGGGVWRARVFAEHFDYRYRSARGDLPIENSGTDAERDLCPRPGGAEPPLMAATRSTSASRRACVRWKRQTGY